MALAASWLGPPSMPGGVAPLDPCLAARQPAGNPASASCRDTRSVTNIVAGVTRWRRRLDYVIDQLSKR